MQPRRVGGALEEEALAHSRRTGVKSLGFVMYQLCDLKSSHLAAPRLFAQLRMTGKEGGRVGKHK